MGEVFIYKVYDYINDGVIFKLDDDNIKTLVKKDMSQEYRLELREFIQSYHVDLKALLHINKSELNVSRGIINTLGVNGLLSSAQERLWFIENYEGSGNLYTVPLIKHLAQTVDIQILEQALTSTVLRHEVLHSKISTDINGNFYQVACDLTLDPLDIIKVKVVDYEDLSRQIKININTGFKLDQEYPIRITLYSFVMEHNMQSAENVYFCIMLHHIVFDGWSQDILLRDLQEYYTYYMQLANDVRNKTSFAKLNLPNLSIQYKDFAVWQKNMLRGDKLEQSMSYWRQKLSDYESLNLPIDKPRPSHIDYVGDDIGFNIDANTSNKLRMVAKELDVSLYCVALSGFNLLLRAYSNQNDIVIGTPITNREHPQLANLIGFFVNTLVFRSIVDPEQTVGNYIRQTGIEMTDAQLYQDLPFEKLVEEFEVTKDVSKNPIFQVRFGMHGVSSSNPEDAYQQLFTPDIKSPGYELDLINMYKVAKFDLMVMIDDNSVELKGVFNYATSLFEKSTILNLISTYKYILQQLPENLCIKIKTLSYLPAASYQKVIYDWNETEGGFLNDESIQQLFELQVARTPDNIAVVYDNTRLTYRELNQKSNQIAIYIKSKYDIEGDDLIILCLDRSEHLIIAMLGALKSGGAYVPLDPDYPDERVCHILIDTKAKVVITNEVYAAKLAILIRENNLPTPVLVIDSLGFYEDQDLTPANFAINTINLAYVIYTSGSTGTPKGVMVENRSLVNYTQSIIKRLTLSNLNKSIVVSDYIFDLGNTGIYPILLSGGEVHLGNKDQYLESSYLVNYILDNQINFLKCTPLYFESLFVDYLLERDIRLENFTLVLGGESCSLNLMNFIRNRAGLKVINHYGPTEATVGSTCSLDFSTNVDVNIIGKPLDNVKCYILNADLNPLPLGAIGELHIGGMGLARGYLNRPDLTNEKFIANLFQNKEEHLEGRNARLYKTGDLVKYLPDGNIKYVGRTDFQVKIRGRRIELGEIHGRIMLHNDVSDAVIVVKDEIQSKKLVAYIVAKDFIPSGTEMKEFLAEMLPDYMVPEYYVFLDKLPLTLNGKLDRRALPDPEITDANNYVAPRDEFELKICSIVAQVLGLDIGKISINDDFFKLGGDSIIAIRLISVLNHALHLSLRVKDIFTHKSIKNIHEFILENKVVAHTHETYTPFSLIDRESYFGIEDMSLVEDIYPASFLQVGMLFEANMNKGTYHDIAAYRMGRSFNYAKVMRIWSDLVKKHELLRAGFVPSDNLYDCIIYKDLQINCDIYYDCDTLELIKEESSKDFDYAKAGLFRLLINVYADKFDFIFSCHHAIKDGWSNASINNEFISAYYSNNQVSKSIEIPYAEFIKNEQSAISNAENTQFWNHYLLDMSLPKIKWKNNSEFDQEQYVTNIELDKATSQKLLMISNSVMVSVDSVFLFIYLITLSKFLNQDDLTIGLVVNNRPEKSGGDQLFGLYLNTIPYRLNLSRKEQDVKSGILEVFNEKLKLYDYKHYPYAKLKTLFGYELYQFVFNFIHFHILDNDYGDIIGIGGFEKTNLPFVLNVIQNGTDSFSLHLVGHADFVDEEYLNYFSSYLERNISCLVNGSENFGSLSEIDYKKQIYAWNNTDKDYPNEKTIHQLFEEQAVRTPHATALIYENTKLTYHELNCRSNQLAHYLRDRYKIQGDDLIALCLDRSEYMVIAILAALKAGGAYVPMDPTYPDERIGYILEDTQAKVILTNMVHEDNLHKILDSQIVRTGLMVANEKHLDGLTPVTAYILAIDDQSFDTECLSLEVKSNLVTAIRSNNLAYVIYTSGTTGKPKGVMIEHISAINTILDSADIYRKASGANVTEFTSYVFDVSVVEIFSTLLLGKVLHLLSSDIRTDNVKLGNYFLENKINIAYLPPVVLSTLSQNEYPSLEIMIYAGEPCDKNTGTYWSTTKQLYNYYGPTEVSIYCLGKQVINGDIDLIGTPISNTTAYILDANLNPLPVGSIGELYIGGAGLARGYLNKPELTAECFISNPFQSLQNQAQNKNARLYKTGDLARYLPDGNVEYIGRNDFQIKIRGVRIELSEIDSVLIKSHPEIKQVATVPYTVMDSYGNATENKYLVAYYVSVNKLDETDLLSYLESNLPEYMMPKAFVWLEVFPLTINGKLDRKSLPQPDLTSEENYIAPRNDLEIKISKIFAEVLGLALDKISISSNFFRLGGNSILAIKLVSLLWTSFSIKLSVADLFKCRTIQLLSETVQSNETIITIPRIHVDNEIQQRLSFAQERLWFIEQYEGGSSAYNIPFIAKLNEDINIEILENALQSVVQRHEVLHSLIKTNADGIGYQSVQNMTDKPLIIHKHHISDEDDALINLMNAEMVHIYDLENEYPICISIFTQVSNVNCQEGQETNSRKQNLHHLCIVVHHIAFDGWSLDIFLHELQVFYKYYLNKVTGVGNTSLVLPELSIQYKDFAMWQRNYLSSDLLDKQFAYWEKMLNNYTVLNLPADMQRPRVANYSGDNVLFSLKIPVGNGLRELAKNLNVSLFTVLLSGYYLLLSKYSHQDDIVIGTAVANRHFPQLEHLIGLFINSLALRSKIDSNNLLISYIKTIGDDVVTAHMHQDLPFEKLVEKLVVNQDTSRHPIFQVMFGMHSFGSIQNNQIFEPYNGSARYNVAKVDLLAMINDHDGKLYGAFNYSVNIFNRQAIEQMVSTYQYILEQISDLGIQSSKRICELNYLSTQEYQQLLYTWNNTYVSYPEYTSVPELFEFQAGQTPDAIAVVYKGRQLSYHELDIQSNQFAHYLKNRYAIKDDDLIVLCSDRSDTLLVAILGILKSGAGYVPVDPGYPSERIAYILSDTRAKVVVTSEAYRSRLNCLIANDVDGAASYSSCSSEVMVIDDAQLQDALHKESVSKVALTISNKNLAYVIYTSGTTGVPKGVMVEHCNVLNYILNLKFQGLLKAGDLVDFSTSIGFDLTVTTTLGALCLGANVAVYPGELQDIDSYKEHLLNNHVKLVKLVPSYFELLVDFLPKSEIGVVILGGEKLSTGLVEKLKNVYASMNETPDLYDEYGPTEATVGACLIKVDLSQKLSIGRPYSNCSAYILSDNLHPLPLGAVGELYLGGFGIARGYLNHEALTAEKFIPNPFQTDQDKLYNRNNLLYKTGDLVRYLPSGVIEYIGRNDFQVKIRGYRIETGEIENIARQHGDVSEAVVIAKETSTGKSLIIYIVANDFIPSTMELEEFLSEKLPRYMLPDQYVFLESLPLTINGKLDRNGLPDPEEVAEHVYVAPRNELEFKVCSIFAESLGLEVEEVGITDDFFRLGGNSILAIKLVSKLLASLGVKISVATLYQYKTIVLILEQLLSDSIKVVTIPKLKVSGDQEQYLSFAQERLWFIEQYEGGSTAYNVPFITKLNSNVEVSVLEDALQSVVHRHEILHSLIKSNIEGVGYQEVVDLSLHPLQIDIHEVSSLKERHDLINQEINHVYKLDEEYPIRLSIIGEINSEPGVDEGSRVTNYLSIVVHHIAFDGWSWDIFLRDLRHYYDYHLALFRGQSIKDELPDLTIQYRDFAVWQRSYLRGDCLNRQLNYWKGKLNGYVSLNLPTDKPRPHRVSYSGDHIAFIVDSGVSHSLRDLARSLNVSLYSVMLSSYYILLGCYANQEDIIVGTPIANRHHQQLENLIGFFVNSLALRRKLNRNDSIISYIKEVGKDVIEAQLHQDLPFEKLVEELGIEQDTSRHPVFQVMFGVQSFGLGYSSELFDRNDERFDYKIAKFDLSTMIDDSQDRLCGVFNYSTSLFVKSSIEYLIGTYQYILQQISSLSATDDMKLKEISYLLPSSYQQVVYAWNQTAHDYVIDKTIQEIFEAQVAKTPDNIALVYEGIELTYKELNSKSNQLAAYLRSSYSIHGDDLVALCLDRSEHLVIAILGVLKSGAAYVPVDLSYPSERIQYILNDTKAKVILTNATHISRLNEIVGLIGSTANSRSSDSLMLLALDGISFRNISSKLPSLNLAININSSNLAYVIYTSGTTGRPKGVLIEHRGVVNLAIAQAKEFGLSLVTNDRMLQKNCLLYASYVFDAHVWELFTVLANGHQLHILKEDLRQDLGSLAKYVEIHKIYLATIPPVLLDTENILRLNTLVVAGDSASNLVLQTYQQNSIKVINAYGPTEATVCATLNHYKLGDLNTNIGKPLSNCEAYILDVNLKPLPIGAIGELYIGGVGLARGYLNQAALTESKFIKNIFKEKSETDLANSSKLYKTGDLARYLPDGSIEYLGRNDFMVKIRGFRVELSEVENRLCAYPEITHAVVVVQAGVEDRHKYLAGYYVAPSQLNEDAILAYLNEYLPSYMIPSTLVWLAKLPLTLNGKLDQKALPAPGVLNAARAIAPRNELEVGVCEVYAHVLNLPLDQISLSSDFFKLGGNSILAIKLIKMINHTYLSHLKVADVFVNKSPNELLNRVIQTKSGYEIIVKLNQAYNLYNMFMIHPGFAGCEVYSSLAHGLSSIYSCYGVDSYNLHHTPKIENLNNLAKYYLEHIEQVMLKTEQQRYILLGWSLGGQIAAEIAHILETRGKRNILLVLLDTMFIDPYVIRERERFKVSGAYTALKAHYKDKYESEYANKLINNLEVEGVLSNTTITGKLNYTKICLFKAMQPDKRVRNVDIENLNLYLTALVDNNVSQISIKPELISIIKLESAHHGNIMEQESRILNVLRDYM